MTLSLSLHDPAFLALLTPAGCAAYEVGSVQNMFSGDAVLNSNADIATYAGFDGISGNLIVQAGVTSLVGLEGLRYVGVSVFLTQASGLTSLAGLNNLTTVDTGGLDMSSNPSITDITALNRLYRVGFDLTLASTVLPDLSNCFHCLFEVGQGLTITNNTSLTTMAGAFPNLTTIGATGSVPQGNLTITGNTALTTMSGAFPVLQSIIHSLTLQNSTVTPPPFSALTSIGGGLRVSNTVNLGSSFLAAVTSVGMNPGAFAFDFFLDNNTITAFPALSALTTVKQSVILNGNSGSFTLNSAFPALTSAQNFHVESNAGLTSATNLAPVVVFPASSPFVEIYTNQSLTTMAGAFTSVTLNDYVELHDNHVLTDITNLLANWSSSVNGHSKYTELHFNNALNLAGAFAHVAHLDYIEIYGTPGLHPGVGNMVNAYPALTDLVDYIEIIGDDGLVTMAGAFPLLATIQSQPGRFDGYVLLQNLANITNATGAFPSLVRLERVEINNTNLSAIGGFTGLTTLENQFNSLGILRLIGNPNLIDITSLSSLTTLAQELTVDSNAVLASVSTLQSINGATITAGGKTVVITNNPNLPTTAQAQALINKLVADGYTGPSTNSGNGPG